MLGKKILLGLFLLISAACTNDNRIDLGRLSTGAKVSFVQDENGLWGVDISGGPAPALVQDKPARVEVYKSKDDIIDLVSGYQSLAESNTGITAIAEISYTDQVVFQIKDQWELDDQVLLVNRVVKVSGSAEGGFNTSLVFSVAPQVNWTDVKLLVPGALYGDPANNGERSLAGLLKYKLKRIILRQDQLPAPMYSLSFNNGSSVTMLTPSPDCRSTVEETKLRKTVLTDNRFQFGSLGAWQQDNSPVEFGFQFPGSLEMFRYGPGAGNTPQTFRRYHPIAQNVEHHYELNFRFGKNESFRDVTKNAWRWSWEALNPDIIPIDVEQMRRVLIDHLAAQAKSIDGRTGIPFAIATFDTNQVQWNWTMSVMGFVSKNLECADQLLRESDRDPSERGQHMRQIGLSIINSMITALEKVPFEGSGYDLATGKPWAGERKEWLAPFLRNTSEGMRVVMRAYLREQKKGIDHPDWFNWVKVHVDWLLDQQRDDGSFPRCWVAGSDSVAETTGSTSYSPVPVFLLLSQETGDDRYKQAAVRAADYVWDNYGEKGYYVGGASDNANITDKEAGMLALEAFLALYESTGEDKWLERAKAAGDYTQTWMWIWDLPMPVDADDASLHWKKGVPTIGLQGITARFPGGADEYMDWSASSYVRLYKYTNDEQYLDVARILLHATKSMVALPGRLYDMKGIGWQQEHWSMGPGRRGRGLGGHRFWLPWVSANHLYSITGIEEVDKDIFKQLSQAK